MAEIKVRMVIDPFRTEGNVLSCAKKLKLPQTMVSVGYENEAGILYVNLSTQKSSIMTS